MDKEKLKAYGVDYENAVKRFAGNEALYERFLKKLTEDDHLAIGEQAMKEERYEDVLEAVHALKGVAGTLGMTELFQAASEVVASIRKNEISHLQEQKAKVHTEFEKACGISYYDFIAKMPEGYGFPLFYSVDGYKDHELTDEMKIHDYVFKFRDGDVIIALSPEEKTKYGNCAFLYEKNKDNTEKSTVNNVEVFIYKTLEAVYISFTSNKCYYDISIYSDITQEEIKTLLYALIANKSAPSTEAPSDTGGNYAEAVNLDILSEESLNIFCGSYLDENGEYTILVTETASDSDKEHLLSEIGRTSENTTIKTAKYTMQYLTLLQTKISDAMSAKELPFVTSSGVYDDKNRIIVTVNTKDESEYQKIYSMDSVGGAIEIQYSEEVFVTCDEIPKTDILPENE